MRNLVLLAGAALISSCAAVQPRYRLDPKAAMPEWRPAVPAAEAPALETPETRAVEPPDAEALDFEFTERTTLASFELGASPSLAAGMLGAGEGESGERGNAPAYDSSLSFRMGSGFTLDPRTFLLALEADYFVGEQLTLGPLLQLGFGDDKTFVVPTLHTQYSFDLSGVIEGWARLKPFLQGGVGFAYIHKDRPRGEDDDVGFLFNLGFGFEYYAADNVAIGTNVLFNILPDKVNKENFFFSCQILTVRFRW